MNSYYQKSTPNHSKQNEQQQKIERPIPTLRSNNNKNDKQVFHKYEKNLIDCVESRGLYKCCNNNVRLMNSNDCNNNSFEAFKTLVKQNKKYLKIIHFNA